jgi:hypothetical protein
MEIKNRIVESFKNEFGIEIEKIEIYDNIAEVNNYWYCRLTSKGVKKNSWRVSHND